MHVLCAHGKKNKSDYLLVLSSINQGDEMIEGMQSECS